MKKFVWEIFLIVCGVLFVVGFAGAFLFAFPWSLWAVIGEAIGVAGMIGFGVWQIILDRRGMKAFDERMKASGEYIKALSEETIKKIRANGEETLRAIQGQKSKEK
ncbi:hypothetical protein D4S03_09720 [bacterium]|nr:MAG: hypothetical protein D4S03_09720 [bacterium]